MATVTESKAAIKGTKQSNKGDVMPKMCKSSKIAEKGIKTVGDFTELMSSMMSDVLSGQLDPGTANAVNRSGANLLKAAEMQYKYAGRAKTPNNSLSLS